MAIRRARWRPERTDGPNKTETRFIREVLRLLVAAGEITRWEFEALKFRFGTDFKATYTPDFLVFRSDGEIELIDVKGTGGWEEDARCKIKACARLYPELHWTGYTAVRGGNGWNREDF